MSAFSSINPSFNQVELYEKIYTIAQVAELLDLEETSIIRFLGEKTLTGYKQAGRWYILHSDVIQFIKSGERN